MIYYLDIIGTLVFAISGTMAASHKKLDLLGASFTGFITAIGGGSVRDMLLGATPVGWLYDTNYVVTILLGIIITYVFYPFINKLRKTLFLFDTIGIATFTIIGINKGLAYNVNPALSILLGVITAVMGGVMRDTFINEIPLIFRKEIYATACILGGIAYLVFHSLSSNESLSLIFTVILIIIIRIVSVYFNLRLPIIHDKGLVNKLRKM